MTDSVATETEQGRAYVDDGFVVVPGLLGEEELAELEERQCLLGPR
jgi:hypothetical protein